MISQEATQKYIESCIRKGLFSKEDLEQLNDVEKQVFAEQMMARQNERPEMFKEEI